MKPLKIVLVILSAVAFFLSISAIAGADDKGVAGCGSVQIDPKESLEFQQNICTAAENNPATSCATGGHGVCSSPKVNDVLSEANHCVCIGEVTEPAPAGEPAAELPPLEAPAT